MAYSASTTTTFTYTCDHCGATLTTAVLPSDWLIGACEAPNAGASRATFAVCATDVAAFKAFLKLP